MPQEPGVYFSWIKNGKIVYIGKATNLKSRVRSYFSIVLEPSPYKGEGEVENFLLSRPIEMMIHRVFDIDFQKTDSVLEALILESNLIKNISQNIMLKKKISHSHIL